MDRDNVYKIIGYKGEYNKEVKAKLRKLLKKYHPDHNNGASETFKIINEIKKELEHGIKLKSKNKNNLKNSNEFKDDLQYYQNQIKILLNENEIIKNKINDNNINIEEYSKKYTLLIEKLTKNQGLLCDNYDNVNYLKKFQKKYIIYILLLVIFAITYLLTKNILFIILLSIITIILTIDILNLYLRIKEITLKSNNYIHKNFDLFKEIKDLKDKINKEKQIILSHERELIKNSNDVRFYQNQLNKK